MPHYHKMGTIPHKRHTQFRKADGTLYSEELFSTEGFSNDYSLLYHHAPPTRVVRSDAGIDISPVAVYSKNLQHRCFKGFNLKPEPDYLQSRKVVLMNADCQIALAAPEESMQDYFYKNADADELVFVHEGCGYITTQYGELDFVPGDYVVIPRGTIYQIHFDTRENRLLVVESFSPIRYPKKYLSKYGQLLEHSPYCERDINPPGKLITQQEEGDFLIKTKKGSILYGLHYANHPLDVVGWDGYCYPYTLSIHDFEPITGRVHQPPPVHQTFEANNFVVCSFVPRLFDYHPDAIPAPYNHSNIDSDEVLYYVDGDFMSRKNIEKGMITLHPAGIPHGPHPGTVLKSIGAKETRELAVMIDTFHPLYLTNEALKMEVVGYGGSWVE